MRKQKTELVSKTKFVSVSVHQADSICRNMLSIDTIERLRHELEALNSDNNVKAVILAADGPVFSAGHDLKELVLHLYCAGYHCLHLTDTVIFLSFSTFC